MLPSTWSLIFFPIKRVWMFFGLKKRIPKLISWVSSPFYPCFNCSAHSKKIDMVKIKNLLLLAVMVGGFACGPTEKAKLKDRVAELEEELAQKEQHTKALAAITGLLDSIETYEKIITVDLEKGITKEDYTGRIKGLGAKLSETQKKVSDLEKALSKSSKTSKDLAASISVYKKKLAEKEEAMAKMNEMIEKLTAENNALINITQLQKQELEAQESQINSNKQAIATMEEEIRKLQQGNEEAKAQARKKEADLNFVQGEKTHEIARKTVFASKKKKELLNQALSYYKAAFEGGRKDALDRIDEIEKDLK
jgi:chromosome segregation ATPase